MKLALSLAAAAAAVLSTLSVAPAATADDPTPEVTVVWPEITRFNPSSYTYDAVVTNTGSARLFSTFGSDVGRYTGTAVPASGHVTIEPWRNESGVITIWSCAQYYSDGTCTAVATSPELDVYSRLSVSAVGDGVVWMKPGTNHQRISYTPGPPETATPSATWELLNRYGQPMSPAVTGSVPAAGLARDENSVADAPIDLPANTRDGSYYLDIDLAVDDPTFGHLEGGLGAFAVDVRVDTVSPTLSVGTIPPVIYPVTDGYLDDLAIDATASEDTVGTFEVLNAAGTRVHLDDGLYLGVNGGSYVGWNGRGLSGAIVPEGTYTLRLTVADDGGNTAVWARRIRVSHQRVQMTTTTVTVPAAPYLGAKLVGRCSKLARKPHGVLGFYSQKKCTGDDRASVVVANFGMYLPQAFRNSYDWGQVTVNGSPATRSRKNYLVLAFVKPDGTIEGRREFHAGTKHTGPQVSLANVVFDRTKPRPYLVWTTGLSAGSRYNVRSFTIRVRYQVLR